MAGNGRLTATAQQHRVSSLRRNTVDPRDHVDEEWIGEIRDDDAERVRAALDQRPSDDIRPIAKLFRRPQDALAGRVRHTYRRAAPDNQRDQRLRDSSPAGDV